MASLLDIAKNLYNRDWSSKPGTQSISSKVNPILQQITSPTSNLGYMRSNMAAAGQNIGNAYKQWQAKPSNQLLRNPRVGIQNIRDVANRIMGGSIAEFGSIASSGTKNKLAKNIIEAGTRIPGAISRGVSFNLLNPLQNTQATTGAGKFGEFLGSVYGYGQSPITKAIIGATNPIASRAVSRISPQLAGIAGRAAPRIAGAAANVGQGLVFDVANRQPTTPLSVGVDIAAGLLGGPSQFRTAGKGFTMSKNTMDELIKAEDMMKYPDRYVGTFKTGARTEKEALKIIRNKGVQIIEQLSAKYLPNEQLSKTKNIDQQIKALVNLSQKNQLGYFPEMGIVGKTKTSPEITTVRPSEVAQTFKLEKFNLNKQQTKTLDNLRKTLGFETRSVRSFEDMKAMAEELGTNPGQLLKDIQTNKLTDKEVVALGNVISTSSQRIASLQKQIKANPANTELLGKLDLEERVLEEAISKRIRGGTELGRAVAAFRIIANKNLDPAYWLTKAQKQLGETRPLTSQETTAISQLIKNKDRIGLAKFVSLLGESSLREKAIGLWKAGLLTSFRTHEANIISNALFGALETAKDIPATAFDITRSAVTGKPRAKSFGIRSITGQIEGIGEGLKQAKQSFLTGVDARDVQKLDTYKPLRFGNSKAGRLAQKYTNAIFGALGSEDKVFREMAVQRSLADQAGVMALNNKKMTVKQLEELIANPTREMLEQAINDAKTATFNNDNVISDAVRAAKRSGGQGVATALDFVMPFVRTPTNVLARVVDYTPVGIVRDTVRKIINGGAINDRQLAESFGRSVTGLGLIWAGMQLAKAGKIQGASPSSEAERSQMYLEGRQPNSILINGKWRKIDRFSPLGNLLVLGAEYQKTGSLEETSASTLKALTEQSFLQGASQAIGAVQDPRRGAKKYIEKAVGGVIPNIIKDVARGSDEYKRETNGIIDSLKYGLPGLRKTLPPMVDAMGRPVRQEGGMLTALFDPTNPTAANTDPIIQEMSKVGYNLNEVGDTINKEKLTPAQKEAYQRAAGEQIQRFVPSVIQSGAYQQADVDTQKSLIEKAVNKAKDFAREQIKADLPNIKRESGIAVKAAETTTAPNKVYSYVDEDGSLKIVDLSQPISLPKTSADFELNKKLISSYKSKLTSRQTQIANLYNAGQITEAEAISLWDEVEKIKSGIKSGGKKKFSIKYKPLKLSAPKIRKSKTISLSLPKLKTARTKGYKIIQYKDVTPAKKKINKTVRWS